MQSLPPASAPSTGIQRRLLGHASEIAGAPPEELAFTHSVLTQTSLPTVRPPDGLQVWERQQGRARLRVEAGSVLDPVSGRFVQPGLPFGPKARLLLMHLNGEAVRRQSPVIPVEETMTAFFRRLMGRKQDGRQAAMLKAQLSALSAATFRFGIVESPHSAMQVDAKVVGALNLWLERDRSQRVLWPRELRLSLDYFESLTRFAVPLDERAIAALAHSATALDVYGWMAQRLHRIPVGAPQLVSWAALHEQFGSGYRELRKFRRTFRKLLLQVKAVYPDARFAEEPYGLTLATSAPPVAKRPVVFSTTKLTS